MKYTEVINTSNAANRVRIDYSGGSLGLTPTMHLPTKLSEHQLILQRLFPIINEHETMENEKMSCSENLQYIQCFSISTMYMYAS